MKPDTSLDIKSGLFYLVTTLVGCSWLTVYSEGAF